jgi:hypothetical protein
MSAAASSAHNDTVNPDKQDKCVNEVVFCLRKQLLTYQKRINDESVTAWPHINK